MKSKNIQLGSLFDPIATFLRRFHMLLFFLVVSGGLFMAILVLISIINASGNTSNTSANAINGTFDENTIQRVKNDTTNVAQPGNRPSPFVE